MEKKTYEGMTFYFEPVGETEIGRTREPVDRSALWLGARVTESEKEDLDNLVDHLSREISERFPGAGLAVSSQRLAGSFDLITTWKSLHLVESSGPGTPPEVNRGGDAVKDARQFVQLWNEGDLSADFTSKAVAP